LPAPAGDKSKKYRTEDYAIVVKNSADMICSVDATTLRIKTVNPAVEKILGYKQAEILAPTL
jgi:PAS domain S-box-containing protein